MKKGRKKEKKRTNRKWKGIRKETRLCDLCVFLSVSMRLVCWRMIDEKMEDDGPYMKTLGQKNDRHDEKKSQYQGNPIYNQNCPIRCTCWYREARLKELGHEMWPGGWARRSRVWPRRPP